MLENIRKSHQAGRSPYKIASRMNELGVVAGMVGVRWTAKKVKKALTRTAVTAPMGARASD